MLFFQVGRTECYCSNALVPTRRGISECMSVCLGDDKGICGATNKAAFYDTSKVDLSECVPRKNLFHEHVMTQFGPVYTRCPGGDVADAVDKFRVASHFWSGLMYWEIYLWLICWCDRHGSTNPLFWRTFPKKCIEIKKMNEGGIFIGFTNANAYLMVPHRYNMGGITVPLTLVPIPAHLNGSCALGTHDCDDNALCTDNNAADYLCSCAPNYYGNGTRGNCHG